MNVRLLLSKKLSLFVAVGATLFCLLSPMAVSAAGQQLDVCGSGTNSGSTACNKFVDTYINPAIVVLTALVGITAVISIIMAGIQYTSSADDSGAVTKAKQRIFNTIIGLVAYIFLVAFLNY